MAFLTPLCHKMGHNTRCLSSNSWWWGISHKTSSPIYPKSNGLIEKAMQTYKNIFTKPSENRDDPYLSLLEYRNTPTLLLMSRQLYSALPCTRKYLQKQVVPTNTYLQTQTEAQSIQKHYFNKHAKPHTTLHAGDTMYYQNQPDSVGH